MDLRIVWTIVLVLFILVEIFTFNLVSIWFILGSVVSLALAFFNDNFILQLLIFCIVSLVTLIIMKPLVNKYMKEKISRTNLDSVIGKIAVVVKAPTDITKGRVKVDGKSWTIITDDDLVENDKVEVLEIEGVKLKVRKVKK